MPEFVLGTTSSVLDPAAIYTASPLVFGTSTDTIGLVTTGDAPGAITFAKVIFEGTNSEFVLFLQLRDTQGGGSVPQLIDNIGGIGVGAGGGVTGAGRLGP